MKIKTKLIIAFIIPLLLIGTISILGYIWSRSLFITATEINATKVKLALTIEATNKRLANYTLLYYIFPKESERERFESLALDQQKQIDNYKKLHLSKVEQDYLAQLSFQINKNIELDRLLFSLAKERFNNVFQGRQLLRDKIRPTLKTWNNSIVTLDSGSLQKKIVLSQLSAAVNTLVAIARINMIISDNTSTAESQEYLTRTKQLLADLEKFNLNPQETLWLSQLKNDSGLLINTVIETLSYDDKKNSFLLENTSNSSRVDELLNKKLYAIAHNQTDRIQQTIKNINYGMIITLIILILLGILLSSLFARYLMKPIDFLRNAIVDLRAGKEVDIKRTTQDEMGDLSEAFGDLVDQNKKNENNMADQNWLKENISEILTLIQNELTLEKMCNEVLAKIANLLDAGYGAFYITQKVKDSKSLRLRGSYGYTTRKNISNKFKFGESLVGQCALEEKPIILTQVPDNYIHITSGLGDSSPSFIIVLPLIFETMALGVIELAFFKALTPIQIEFLEQIAPNLAVTIETIKNRDLTEKALLQVQQQSEQLQIQQEELRTTNEELEEKTQSLLQSEEELKTQSEELQATNEELEEKMQAIDAKNQEIELKNQELKHTQIALEEKAKSLARSGKYKSEFLSNMSHELRTPLNSLLLLSKSFADNEDGNLTDKQIEEANIIYKGGKDLLELINDILDLSKVEAGKLNIHIEKTPVANIINDLRRQFEGIIKSKNLTFETKITDDIQSIETDTLRLKQILTNLIANAIKFTSDGKVALIVSKANSTTKISSTSPRDKLIVFKVIDTGVGIEKEKQEEIFEAFQQAYGNTDRIYGGTGLGLTISRELTHRLGGEISVESSPGHGSTFTVVLPINGSEPNATPKVELSPSSETSSPIDNNALKKSSTILLVEDDKVFISVLENFAKNKGYNCLKAFDGKSGIALAEQYLPDGIILDLGLPDINGIEVIEHLKNNPKTKNIPIHIISGSDKKALPREFSEINFIKKPASKNDLDTLFNCFTKQSSTETNILFINSHQDELEQIKAATAGKKINFSIATTGKQAIEMYNTTTFNGIILDLSLPDMDGLTLLKELASQNKVIPQVIIYSSRDLSEDEFAEINLYTNNIVRKSGKNSIDRLLHECSLFLYSVNQNIPLSQRATKNIIFDSDQTLRNKKVLLVDDDMRNVYALSKLLQNQGMVVIPATNGQEALYKLQNNYVPDIVIMDIMMPVLDGYETIKRIRKINSFKQLPIIAVTAKAMPEDRNACLEAGADDYLVKPVDGDKLLGMLRVWLSK